MSACPSCNSTNYAKDSTTKIAGYGPGLAVCRECGCLWEFYSKTALSDPNDPLSPFKKPCNNCAFRPGSKERGEDDWGILRVLEAVSDGQDFHCHKGVPITADAKHGFDYPDGFSKLRLCRGALQYRETGVLLKATS